MSFSSSVKDELCREVPEELNIMKAELAGMLAMTVRVRIDEDDLMALTVSTEHPGTARKCFTLMKKTYNIGGVISAAKSAYLKQKRLYTISVRDDPAARNILTDSEILDSSGEIGNILPINDDPILSGEESRRAYLRGAFLASGSISDPEKSYHLEIVCSALSRAQQLRDLIRSFGPDARISERKKSYIVYLKGSEDIVDMLGIMGASLSFMELENVRIMKDVRNNINRKVNFETANINKTVSASVRQSEDIEFIRNTSGLDVLPPLLREMAVLRSEYPDATLAELGELADPPVGKSGVNHRLRKISEYADSIRGGRQ